VRGGENGEACGLVVQGDRWLLTVIRACWVGWC